MHRISVGGPHDTNREVKNQLFEAFDLYNRLTAYGNVTYIVVQHILDFTYVDLEPIFLVEKLH